MNYDPRVINNFARWHFAAVSFISTACGLVGATLLAVYGSKMGLHTCQQPQLEVFSYMGYTVTGAGAYALGGFAAGWVPGFIAGKIVGFFVGYPLKVNAQILLLALNLNDSIRKPGTPAMGAQSGGSVLDFKRAA